MIEKKKENIESSVTTKINQVKDFPNQIKVPTLDDFKEKIPTKDEI